MAMIACSIETGLLLPILLIKIYKILSARIRSDQIWPDGIQVNVK